MGEFFKNLFSASIPKFPAQGANPQQQRVAPPPPSLTDPNTKVQTELEDPEGLIDSQAKASQLGLSTFLRPLLFTPKAK